MFDNSHSVNDTVGSAAAHPQQGLFVANLAKCDKPLMASSRLDSESSQDVCAQPSEFPVTCDGTLLLCCPSAPVCDLEINATREQHASAKRRTFARGLWKTLAGRSRIQSETSI